MMRKKLVEKKEKEVSPWLAAASPPAVQPVILSQLLWLRPIIVVVIIVILMIILGSSLSSVSSLSISSFSLSATVALDGHRRHHYRRNIHVTTFIKLRIIWSSSLSPLSPRSPSSLSSVINTTLVLFIIIVFRLPSS